MVRIIFFRNEGRRSCSTARPDRSGPKLMKKLAFRPYSARISAMAGTPSFMPRKVSTSTLRARSGILGCYLFKEAVECPLQGLVKVHLGLPSEAFHGVFNGRDPGLDVLVAGAVEFA